MWTPSLQIGCFLYSGPLTGLGRFSSFRRLYSVLKRLRRRPKLRLHSNNIEDAGKCLAKRWATDFDLELIGACIEDLEARGVSQRLRLPEPALDDIIAYAHSVPFRALDDRSSFRIADLADGPSNGAGWAVRGICSDVVPSETILRVLGDYVLCQIATLYLGYEPGTVEAYLEVLSAPRGPADGAGSYPPFEYHYDVPGLNFVGFFFYLTDVDQTTGGAHVIILNSNHDKPLRFMLRSARSAGRHVFEYYDPKAELTVYGAKGAGFVEDLYAFHKVNRPRTTDRLALHIRYY